jgi:hypothetical protein
MASFDAGKLPPKPLVTTSRTDSTSVSKQSAVETVAPAVTKAPGSAYKESTTKAGEKLVADGARADTPHAPAGSLGWAVADPVPVSFSGAKDVQAAQDAAKRSVQLLEHAVADVKAGDDGQAALKASSTQATELYKALSAFLGTRPLLAANELPAVKQLIPPLLDGQKLAEAGGKQLLTAQREQLKGKGLLEKSMLDLGAYNGEMLAQKLAEEADKAKTPVFAEYFGKLMVVKPGENTPVRLKEITDALSNQVEGPRSTLSNLASQLARRVEITESQAQPVRTNDEITKASVEYGVKNGYEADSLASTIGGALQSLTNYGEIDQFAKHLLELSLDTVKDVKDPAQRMDQAKQRAQYWVGNYGRNEREIDPIWYQALDKHAAALKAG